MIVPVFLPHLGCHDRCIYCDQGCITNVYNSDVPALIKKTLEKVPGKYEVGLYGGNIFNVEPSELKTLFKYFDNFSDKISNFRISTKPFPLNHEVIRMLKENRVTVIELGMPVFNDTILEKLNRKHTIDDFYRAFNLLKGEGFDVAIQVMVGLPDETMKDIKDTVKHIIKLHPHYIRIYPLVVLRDTPLHRMYKKGFFKPVKFEEALDRTTYIYINALKHGLKVVKMGLTDNEIIKDTIVAGQFHPAYGYMVKSRAFYLALKANMDIASIKGDVSILLNAADIPHLTGHKRSNIEKFKEQGIYVTWETIDTKKGDFILCTNKKTNMGTIFDALLVL